MFTPEERTVLEFLRRAPAQFFSASEIARRAGGRKAFEEDPRWAIPPLLRLRDRELVEVNAEGHYRYLGKDA
jgi:hypothetical protein